MSCLFQVSRARDRSGKNTCQLTRHTTRPFKRLCKDPSKKFCPSCGGPTLIRASITTHAPVPGSTTPRVEVHLKPHFQYRTRGTKYSIPDPKMGSAKGQKSGGSGLILREDQQEFMRGMKREEGRKIKEERALDKAIQAQMAGKGSGLGSWNDPDVSRARPFVWLLSHWSKQCADPRLTCQWLPEILTTGSSGKGRRNTDGLPQVGHGRKNPNEARRRKK